MSEKKRELRAAKNGQYVRLDHAPGAVQVDFGQFQSIEPIADEGPAEVKRHELVMSFPIVELMSYTRYPPRIPSVSWQD